MFFLCKLLVKTVYPDSSAEERTYDSDNELLTVKNRDGKITSYQYNTGGQLTKTIRPDLTEVEYAYTNMGDLDSISYDNWATIDTEYEYNVAGQIISEVKNGVETTYAYDSIGQLTSRGPPTGNRIEYGYNQYGQLNEMVYPNGITLNYTYDLSNNLKQVKKGTTVLAEYVYDANGNNTRTNYGNGTFEENDYDELNRLTQFTVNNNNNQLYKKELTLNNVGFIIGGKTTVDSTVTEDNTISYTNTQRLENVTNNLNSNIDSYGYDTSNNLTTSPFSINTHTANGQLVNSQQGIIVATYIHDDRGNRTQQATGDTTVDYEWSADNKLNNYTLTNTTNPTLNKDIDFKYDANGLLVEKTNNLSSNNEDYVWDTLSSTPTLIEDSDNSYIYGLGSAPFAQISKTTNDITYLHGDERGSVILATNDTGAKDWSRSYDEYGTTYTQTPSTGVLSPFAYAGEYLDADTGLYNLRARWYEPSTASFISIDPAIGLTGEAYSYASGNPLSYTDPLGLWSQQNTWNSVAGFLDGVTGIPIASTISNAIAPGSVQLCSPEYKISNFIGNVASIFIPGGWAFNALKLGRALSVGKLGNYEKVWVNGTKAKWVDATKYKRFKNGPATDEAVKHQQDALNGRKFLVQRESKQQKDINRANNMKKSGLKSDKTLGDRDEAPPASVSASRNGASSVRYVNLSHNRKHGSMLGQFMGKFPNPKVKIGEWFIYEP